MIWLLACRRDPEPRPEPEETAAPADPGLDPLSMPGEPQWAPTDFRRAADCAACHPDHAAEWGGSMHAYAMVDPLFRALVAQRSADLDGAEDPFCVQCHSAIATRGGEITPGFSFEDLAAVSLEGVTCVSCHQVTGLARPYNSGHVLDPLAPVQGPYADVAETPVHEAARSDLLGTSAFCGGCHDVVETSGLRLERPFAEWEGSPAAADGIDCQDCHMPRLERPIVRQGAPRGSREHRWVGVDEPLLPGFASPEALADLRSRTAALLAGAATVTLELPRRAPAGADVAVAVTVTSALPAHDLPTGSTFVRQLWLEVVATDVAGAVVYESGTLDRDGNLRDRWSARDPLGDPDLVTFGSQLVGADGAPTRFPWRAVEHPSTALPPGHARTATFFVPTASAAPGPLEVAVRLRFRAVPPHLLAALGLDAEAPPIHEVAAGTGAVRLEPAAEPPP